MKWKVDKPLKNRVLVATSGEDRLWKVGASEQYGVMIQAEIDGKLLPAQPLEGFMKFQDPEDWDWVEEKK